MPKLMRRHVNADVSRKGVRYLESKCRLALPVALPRYEKIAIRVSAKPRQDLTAIPSKTPSNVIGNLAVNISPFGLCVMGGNVKTKLASRTVRFAEVVSPVQAVQVLRPKRQGEHNINCNRDLGFDETNTATLKILCNFCH